MPSTQGLPLYLEPIEPCIWTIVEGLLNIVYECYEWIPTQEPHDNPIRNILEPILGQSPI
jgi:hypothetical protein